MSVLPFAAVSRPVHAVSITLRERAFHPLVGEFPDDVAIDAPLNSLQARMLADAIEELWEHTPDAIKRRVERRFSKFNQLP